MAEPGPQEVLLGRGLRRVYGQRDILFDVDVAVERGKVTGLLGPSGSGKSTIFRILCGVERPDSGAVTMGKRDITRLGIDARARLGIGYIPQFPELFMQLTVRDNLQIALEGRRLDRDRAAAVMGRISKAFSLQPMLGNPVATLSGGQRKLAEIAFAMCSFPRFLLLDEPFARLDPINVARVSAILRGLARSGIGILLSDHSARDALALCSTASIIQHGVVIASGTPAAVSRDPQVQAIFLGPGFGGQAVAGAGSGHS
ncbi:ABC transporter ATP-binding protein [Zhengella mangrovi]|uniref:ABC transporter ATP-binding protein n=1 Tax=Zhengella mangrovi TaxID=1982044 RepID=A0A2G1QJF0_9HYPH|nr:ATP-binding cassette domain-containing protein [Zhengella mangrovi]PHP65663.1 ABC transporter ATP-binding protein [Zhengella mangrovi]